MYGDPIAVVFHPRPKRGGSPRASQFCMDRAWHHNLSIQLEQGVGNVNLYSVVEGRCIGDNDHELGARLPLARRLASKSTASSSAVYSRKTPARFKNASSSNLFFRPSNC